MDKTDCMMERGKQSGLISKTLEHRTQPITAVVQDSIHIQSKERKILEAAVTPRSRNYSMQMKPTESMMAVSIDNRFS